MQTSIPISDALTGGGVFTIDGQVLGFIARCQDQPIMIAAAAIDQALRMPTPLETRIEREYGLLLAKAGLAGTRRITGVWIGSRAAQAGLRPGDVLPADADLARWADHPGDEHAVEVRRQNRTMTLQLAPLSQSLASSGLGVTLADDEEAGNVVVHAIAPDSAAMRAGLRSGDVLERVGNAAVRDAASALTAIERARSGDVTVVVARDGKRLELLVTP
jgi:S1-C subfamily serine protease